MITEAEIKKLIRLQVKTNKAHAEYAAFKDVLKERCDHPDLFVIDSRESYGNGHGGTEFRNYKFCKICFARKYYSHWTGPDFQPNQSDD